MKTRPKFLVFLAACVVGLCILGFIRFLIHVANPEPVLKAYLSLHELITPSDSGLYPDILQEKLSREALQTWMQSDSGEDTELDDILQEILRYLTVSVKLDLPDDPIVKYTHYYHLEIENDSNKFFENVSVKFPSIEAVEVRRSRYVPTMVHQDNGRYNIGDIGPNETVDVYAWNSRPFYIQEENGIVLRQGNEPVEILNVQFVRPDSSWVKDNLLLVVLLGGLALFFTQKMVFVIRMCSKNVDPRIGKKINIE